MTIPMCKEMYLDVLEIFNNNSILSKIIKFRKLKIKLFFSQKTKNR